MSTPRRTTARVHLLSDMEPEHHYSAYDAARMLYGDDSDPKRWSAQVVLDGLVHYGFVRRLASGRYKITAAGRHWREES